MLNPFTHKKVLRNGVHGRATIVEERLAALHASGALTDAEFAEQKRRLLDGG